MTAEWTQKCLTLAGKLNYVAIATRPDVSAALSMCMRHASRATKSTFDSLMVIVRYLRDTKHFKIHYGVGLDHNLTTLVIKHSREVHLDVWQSGDIIWFADASQGGERPLQGNLGFIGASPFSWKIGSLFQVDYAECL